MGRSSPLLFLTILVFFVKALLPYGYMPSFSSDGKMEIVICTLQGQKTISVDKSDALNPESHHQDEHYSNSAMTCPYSIVSMPEYLADHNNVIVSIHYQNIAFAVLHYVDVISSFNSLYLSRGPPTHIL